MSLFQCEKCGCIENTALTSGYVGWTSKDDWPAEMRIEKGLEPGKKYCSACFDGKWHGRFPQEFFPVGTKHTDRYGNIV